MNTTQNLWSNVLHCGETIMTTEIPLLVSTSIFLLLPVIFYFCLWRFGTATPSAVSVQKRLSQRFKERWRSRTGSTASHFRWCIPKAVFQNSFRNNYCYITSVYQFLILKFSSLCTFSSHEFHSEKSRMFIKFYIKINLTL